MEGFFFKQYSKRYRKKSNEVNRIKRLLNLSLKCSLVTCLIQVLFLQITRKYFLGGETLVFTDHEKIHCPDANLNYNWKLNYDSNVIPDSKLKIECQGNNESTFEIENMTRT